MSAETHMVVWGLALILGMVVALAIAITVGLRPRSSKAVSPRDVLAILIPIVVLCAIMETSEYTRYERRKAQAASHGQRFIEQRGDHEFWDGEGIGSSMIQTWRLRDSFERRAGFALGFGGVLTAACAIARVWTLRVLARTLAS